MDNIIEKLGITPGPWERNNEYGGFQRTGKPVQSIPHSSCFRESAFSPDGNEEE